MNGKVQPQDVAGKHTNVYITRSASGVSITASQEFPFFLEVKVGVEGGYLIGGVPDPRPVSVSLQPDHAWD